MARRLPSEANFSAQPALFLPFLAIWVAMTISLITVICGFRPKRSGKSTPPLSSSPSGKAIQATHITKRPTPPSIALEKSPHQSQEQEQPPTPKSKDTSSSSSSQDQSIVPLSNTPSTRRKLMRSISMKLHMGLPRIGTGKEEEQRRRQQKQQQHHHHQHQQRLLLLQQIDNEAEDAGECLWKKSIILGERCRVSNDDEDAVFYDEKGNKVMAYTPRTPRPIRTSRSLPVSRTSSYFDLELE